MTCSHTATWDFRKYVLKTEAATHWKIIGRQLGLDEDDIKAIHHEHGQEACRNGRQLKERKQPKMSLSEL